MCGMLAGATRPQCSPVRPAFLCLTLLLVACTSTTPPAPAPSTPVLPLRPASSPDFYILGVSGKCLRDDLGRVCQNLMPSGVQVQNTAHNYDYLSGRGTLDAIAGAVRKNGWSTRTLGYAASLTDRVNTGTGQLATHSGFLTLIADLRVIVNRDIEGVRNPSRLILVGHSHGTVWSHLLTALNPDLPVEIQVDFDGVCAYWQSDNQGDFEAAGLGTLIDFERVCRTRDSALGGDPNDLQNVVYGAVRTNLDVHSRDPLLLDLTKNARPDGSHVGIYSADFAESHSGVTQPGSAALTWVTQSVENLTRR